MSESLPDTHATGSDPASTMVDLGLPECLRLLADGDVGRIAVAMRDQRLPVIRPVNYVFDESSRSVLIPPDADPSCSPCCAQAKRCSRSTASIRYAASAGA